MPQPSGLSVVVPLYRDESTVEALVDDALRALAALALPFEILLVDDASPDSSGDRARAAAARAPQIRALAHPENRGLGGALSTGILAARHSHVLYTDGDHGYSFADLARFVAALDHADFVTGIRPRALRPLGRRAITSVWSVAIAAAFGLALRDVNCSFKLFPATALDGRALRARHGFADAELLLRARAQGLRIAELPVRLRTGPARSSNFLAPRLMLATAAEGWRAWRAGSWNAPPARPR